MAEFFLPRRRGRKGELTLTTVIETLTTLGKAQLPQQLARWLDALDETGRWALIKLVTGGLRIGVSARLAKAAVAALADKDAQEIELLWPGLAPPYRELFAWLEGHADEAGERRCGAVPAADAGACARRRRFAKPRCIGVRRGMEMGRHSRAGRRRAPRQQTRRQTWPPSDRPPLLAHRRGHFEKLSRPARRAAPARRHRRRTFGHARSPRAVVQRVATAAQSQNRHAEAARRISRPFARLRSACRRRRGFTRAFLSSSAARGSKISSHGLATSGSTCRR